MNFHLVVNVLYDTPPKKKKIHDFFKNTVWFISWITCEVHLNLLGSLIESQHLL